MTTTIGGRPPRGRGSVLVLGSTGSVGTQALDVVAARPERFTRRRAGGGRRGRRPARRTGAGARGAAGSPSPIPGRGRELRRALPGVDVLAGPDAATELTATTRADTVLNGITGSRGLGPTLAALATGATLALANKESLVAGGPLVTAAAAPGQIVPVDSEHSALAQCLRGGRERRGRPAGAHRVRRPVPRTAPRRAGRRHARAGARAPDLDDGTGRHHQLRDPGQQGPGADRGAPAVRRALRPDRRRRAPAVGGALDGHLHRRVDAGPGEPAGHAAADRARAGLAGAGRRGRGACTWDVAAGVDVRAAGRRRVPRRAARPAGRRGGRLPAGGVQRRERGGRRRIRRGRAGLPRRHRVVEDTIAAADGWRPTRRRRRTSPRPRSGRGRTPAARGAAAGCRRPTRRCRRVRRSRDRCRHAGHRAPTEFG